MIVCRTAACSLKKGNRHLQRREAWQTTRLPALRPSSTPESKEQCGATSWPGITGRAMRWLGVALLGLVPLTRGTEDEQRDHWFCDEFPKRVQRWDRLWDECKAGPHQGECNQDCG